ncbi:MAG TPA: glycoside hydrolase family 36 protein [Draconibacterium sp.]|nr:glycoside hydrolase family 36 protein [Draconibacterium sp.]
MKLTLILSLLMFISVSSQSQTPNPNIHFQAEFDLKQGSFSVKTTDNQINIIGITSVIHTTNGSFSTAGKGFEWKKPIWQNFKDSVGTGSLMITEGFSKKLKIGIQQRVYHYDSFAGIVLETIISNRSARDLNVYSIEPMHVIEKDSGNMFAKNLTKALLNGAMYYDAGSIHTFGTPYLKPAPYGETKGGVMHSVDLSQNPETVESWWNIGLFGGYEQPGISFGYIRNRESLGRIRLLKTGGNKFNFIAESVFNNGHLLKAGQSLSTDGVLINIGKNPYETLENYGSALGKANGALTGDEVNGWCNWFYTHDYFDENEILMNAEFAAKYLKPYGMEYIQIDEGFQRMHGEWEGNSRFPDGLKSFAGKIKEVGLKPGIWIAPFVISENTWVHKTHTEWLLKNPDGSLKRIGPWPGEDTDWYKTESPKRYCLDITHPAAEQWFTSLIDTIANMWGFEMIKIDFVAWTVFSAHHFYDPQASPAEVYQKAMAIIHRVAGDKCHILDCGPGQVSVGSIHSMRVEYDQNYGYFPEVWKQFFEGTSSSAGALGKRYFYHNRAWTNDIDHICIDLVSNSQAEAIASLIALSGGNTISGDRLTGLDATKISILQKVFPSSGISARPVNLLDADPQTAFAVQLSTDSAEWTVAGFFNPELEKNTTHSYPVERLWLDQHKKYLCFDFWKQRLLGEISDTIRVPVEAGGVTILSIHEKQRVPQVLSTTRHIMQGLFELETVSFNSASNQLSGVSKGPVGSKHSVFIYVPEGFIWNPAPGRLFRDFGKYAVKSTDNQILRIDLDFSETESIDWKVDFEKDQ